MEPDTFDFYIPQYASTNASCPHSVVLQDIDHLHVDTLQHVEVITTSVADDEAPALCLNLSVDYQHQQVLEQLTVHVTEMLLVVELVH